MTESLSQALVLMSALSQCELPQLQKEVILLCPCLLGPPPVIPCLLSAQVLVQLHVNWGVNSAERGGEENIYFGQFPTLVCHVTTQIAAQGRGW